LKAFKSVNKVKEAGREEIAKIAGGSRADIIQKYFAEKEKGPG